MKRPTVLGRKTDATIPGHQRSPSSFPPLGTNPTAESKHLLSSLKVAFPEPKLVTPVKAPTEEKSKDLWSRAREALHLKKSSEQKDDPTVCDVNGETAISRAWEKKEVEKDKYNALINAVTEWRKTYKREEKKDSPDTSFDLTKFLGYTSNYLHQCVNKQDHHAISGLWQWVISETSKDDREIKANFNPNIKMDNQTPLTLAAREGYLATVNTLLLIPEICAGVKNDFSMTAVMAATAAKQDQCLKSILDSLNDKPEMLCFVLITHDDEARTPLMKAAAQNDVKSLALLLSSQSNLDLATRATLIQYALEQAVKYNGRDALATLLKAHVELFPREARTQLLPAGVLETAIASSSAATILALLNHETLEIPENVIHLLIKRVKEARARPERLELQIKEEDLAEIIRRLLVITAPPPTQALADKMLEQLFELMQVEKFHFNLLEKIRHSEPALGDSILSKMGNPFLALHWFIGIFIRLTIQQQPNSEVLAGFVSDPLIPLPENSIDLLRDRQKSEKLQINDPARLALVLCSILAKQVGGADKLKSESKQIDEIITTPLKMDHRRVVVNLLTAIDALSNKKESRDTSKDIETAQFLFRAMGSQKTVLGCYVKASSKDLPPTTPAMLVRISQRIPKVKTKLIEASPQEIYKVVRNRQLEIPPDAIRLLYDRQQGDNPIPQPGAEGIALYAKIIYTILIRLAPPLKDSKQEAELEKYSDALCEKRGLTKCLLEEAQRLYDLENRHAVSNGHRYLMAESLLENAIDPHNALGWYMARPDKRIDKTKEVKEKAETTNQYSRLYQALERVKNGDKPLDEERPLAAAPKKSITDYDGGLVLQPRKSTHHLQALQEHATIVTLSA